MSFLCLIVWKDTRIPESRAVIEALVRSPRAVHPANEVVLSTVGAQALQPDLRGQLRMMEQAFTAVGSIPAASTG